MTASEAERSRTIVLLRKLAHLLMVVLGWVGFVWMWLLVAARPWDSHGLVWLIVGSAIVAPLLTGAWVLHNRALYRRKGERQAVATADMRYERDWHGRSVHADWAMLRNSRVVRVRVDGERKTYLGSLIGAGKHAQPAVPHDDDSSAASPAVALGAPR